MAAFYNPAHFRVEDTQGLHAFIAAHPFATLVSSGAAGLSASHVPMLLETNETGAVLRGHVAKANGHWKELGDGVDALAIFHGPQAYVSPQWYPSKLKDARVVPTWNYAVVHVRGRLRAVHDAAWLRKLVGDLTDAHEAAFAHQWKVTDAPDDYIDKAVGAIVGLELAVTGIEGKWKLSQNKPETDRVGILNGLAAQADPYSREVAELMRNEK